jgi:nucleoside-diphosphate-sugar epimerase
MDPFDGRVVSSFIRQGILQEPFSVFGNGTQTRSFCYIDDLVLGLIAMSESEESGPINLGNPHEINLLTLGELVAQFLGVEAKFTFLELPTDDPKHRRPDISLAKSRLSWEPLTDLETGIAKTTKWIEDFLES